MGSKPWFEMPNLPVYSDWPQVMIRDVKAAARLGVHGVVIGVRVYHQEAGVRVGILH